MSHVPPHRPMAQNHARKPVFKPHIIVVIVLMSLVLIAALSVGAMWLLSHKSSENAQNKSEINSSSSQKPIKLEADAPRKVHGNDTEPWYKPLAKPEVEVIHNEKKDTKSDTDATSVPSKAPTSIQKTSHHGSISGLTVLVDPGHSGGVIPKRQVYDGRSAYKKCNTTGTSTNDGYPEHKFNFDVARRLKSKLETAGAKVIMTRQATGPAPCVDKRGQMSAQADVVVSIHANGTTNPSVKGYFALVSSPPLNEAQGQPSVDLALSIMDALAQQGFTASPNYPQGLMKRSDIAGLNHSVKPVVMMEMGEMRNPEEAAVMKTEAGRERYAVALFNGVVEWAKTH